MTSYMRQFGFMNRELLRLAEAAIEMLKAHKLFNQLSFHTVTVALLLKFVESIEVG